MKELPIVRFSDEEEIKSSLKQIEDALNTLGVSESENGIIANLNDDYLITIARIVSAEKNLECGLKMRDFTVYAPSHLSNEIFNYISKTAELLKIKRLALIKTILYHISNNYYNDFELNEFVSVLKLVRLYDFCIGYNENETDFLSIVSVKSDGNNKSLISLYEKGVGYYVAARARIEEKGKKRLPSPAKFGLTYENPFVILAHREYELEKNVRGLTLDINITGKDLYWLDEHTKMRIVFRHAVAQYFYDGTWSEIILTGFRTGLKRDADLAVAAIMKAVKKTFDLDFYIDACKTASSYGYRSVDYSVLFFRRSDNLDKQDLFELFICAQDNDEYAYRYLKAHDNLSGKEEDLLNADISISARLELFNRIKNDPAALETSYNEARRLWNLKTHSDSGVAIWLGNYHFKRKEYKDAFDIFYRAYRIYKTEDLAWQISQCYLHGYGVAENYDEAKRYMSFCRSEEGQVANALFRVYGIGGKPNSNESSISDTFSNNSSTEKIANAFITVAKINIRHNNFWRNFWEWHDNYCGLTLLNINEKKLCYRPFIEFCSVVYVIMISRQKKIDYDDFSDTLEYLKSEGSVFSTILNYQLNKQYNSFDKIDKKSLPKKPLLAYFNKNSRYNFYNKIAQDVDKCLTLILDILQNLYNEQKQQNETVKFTDKNFLPWMDELCKTLEGRRLYNEATNTDSWTSRKIFLESAQYGDSNSALRLFMSRDYIQKDAAALGFLNIAVQCNEPRALVENTYLKEHGVLNSENIFEDYRKAIIKGNSCARANALVYYNNIVPSFFKSKAIHRLIKLNEDYINNHGSVY